MRTPGFVYFVRCGNAVKIGFSRDPRLRFSRLQLPEFAVLGIHPGTFADENCLHKIFSNQRIRGEWFTQSEKLLLAAAKGLTEPLRAEAKAIGWFNANWPPIERAIEFAGSEAKLGEGTGFSQVAINKAKRRGSVSAEMALAIHRFTGGVVPASALRPDLWQSPNDVPLAPPLVPDDPAPESERTS